VVSGNFLHHEHAPLRHLSRSNSPHPRPRCQHRLVAADTNPRERQLADFGWRFHLGNEWGPAQNLAKAGSGYGPASVDFSDASWRRVDLPHDWAVELPFDAKADGAHGFKPVGDGFPQNSVGWYRRTFELPKSDAGRRLWLELDGVFRDSTVFVNGWFVGRHESGYGSFRYDITDVANVGGRTSSRFVSMPRNSRAGSMRARASTATCGW
jgi:beta-galactosidase